MNDETQNPQPKGESEEDVLKPIWVALNLELSLGQSFNLIDLEVKKPKKSGYSSKKRKKSNLNTVGELLQQFSHALRSSLKTMESSGDVDPQRAEVMKAFLKSFDFVFAHSMGMIRLLQDPMISKEQKVQMLKQAHEFASFATNHLVHMDDFFDEDLDDILEQITKDSSSR